MILKHWGRRYGVWFGAGSQSERTRFITRTWLRTTLPPYLRGVGVSLSVNHKSIRFGVYKVLGKIDPEDYDDVDVEEELQILRESLGWHSGVESEEVIRTWQRPQSDPEDSPTSVSAPESGLSSSTLPASTSGPSPSP